MSQSRPLDVVIRKVEKGTKNNSDAAKIVIIDCRKKKAVPKPPFFGETKYFLVSNSDDPRHKADCRGPVCPVDDFETGREIGVRVNYQARVAAGSEEQAAEALFDAPHPGAALDGLLKKWVAAFTREDPGRFISNYYQSRQELQQYIQREAESEAGLTLKVSLTLDGEEALAPFKLGPTRCMVRLKDYDREQELKVAAELVVEESDKVNAVLSMSAEDRLEPRVMSAVRRHLAEHVTLQQFCTQLNGESFKAALRAHLDETLRGTGRRVEHLTLESPATALIPDEKKFFELKHVVECEIPEYPEPVKIKNTLQMELTDAARYQTALTTDPEVWIRKSLERVIHEELFGKKYIHLLLNFKEAEEDGPGAEGAGRVSPNGSGTNGEPQIAARIKERMKEYAAHIGYRLEQLISQPDLAPYRLLDNFTVSPERTFATRVSDVHVKLRIVVVAKINDLKDVEEYLNRQEDVQQAMSDAAVDEAAQYLHEIDPSDFYMNFSFSDKVGVPTIEETLVTRIKHRLKKQFNARVISVVPVPLDDKLVERLKTLRRALFPFTAEVLPLQSGEKFVFEGEFQIIGVHEKGWYTFQSRDAAMEDVQSTVKKNITACLATRHQEELRNPEALDALRGEVVEEVNDRLREGYGLVMSITTFFRNRTEGEEGVSKVEESYTKEMLMGIEASIDSFRQMRESQSAQLRSLLERREEIIIAEENSAELEELDEKINTLQGQLAATSKKLVRQQLVRARVETLPGRTRHRQLGGPAAEARKALSAGEPAGEDGRVVEEVE